MAEKQKNYLINNKKQILLHACCGICSSYPISYLQDMGYEVIVYFYNPNIYPDFEYKKRLEAERILCNFYKCMLIVGDYDTDKYYEVVKGLENEPEKGLRCDKCFELRLEQTAKKSKILNIHTFTTSMVISPHKNYEKLTKIGLEIARKYNLEYLTTNFRKNNGFLKTNQISRSLNLYRQNYCGCKFAIN